MQMDPAILEFFDSITGSGAVNLAIVVPKYEEMRALARQFVVALMELGEGPLVKARPAVAAEIVRQAAGFHREFDEQLCAPAEVPRAMFREGEGTKQYRVQYGELYRASKQAPVLAVLLGMVSALTPLRSQCEGTTEQRSLKSLLRVLRAETPGGSPPEMRVLALGACEDAPAEEVCLVALQAECPGVAEQVWPTLRHIFGLGLELFAVLERPDFDSETISQAVSSSLASCRSSLHGCESGFRLIENSTSLFKRNASIYQRQIEASGNPLDLLQCFCSDLNAFAESQLRSTGTEAERRQARRTKIDLSRIMQHVGRTTNKMSSVAGNTAGGRLLKVLGKQIESTQASLSEEICRDEAPQSADAVRRMTDRIREQQAECEAAAEKHAAEILSRRSASQLLLSGRPVADSSGAPVDPLAQASGGSPWNLRDALAFMGEPADASGGRRKKKKKKKAAAEGAAAFESPGG